MKSPFLILACWCVAVMSFAQTKTDSVQQKMDTVRHRIDTVEQKITHFADKINSLNHLPQLPDSLLPSFHKLDSIRDGFNHQADSLKNAFQNEVSKIDKAEASITHKIDSLEHLKLPTGKYTGKLDSLNRERQQVTSKFNSKASALKAKTTGKLNALDLPPQYKEPLQQITGKVDGFNIQSDFVKIPQAGVPGYSLPNVGNVSGLASKLGTGNIPGVGNLPKIETPVGNLGDISKVTGEVKNYSGDLKNITSGNLNDVKSVPDALEKQATKIDGVGELQKESGVLQGYKDKLDMVKDPASNKDKAEQLIKQQAVDHFAGKEKELKAAMDQVSKYKQKYSSVSSLKDLPKRPPNAMKGKPFIERIVPGLWFQYQQKNANLYDFNLYLGYRISGRFTAGAGWNERYAYYRKYHYWYDKGRIFGPRAYVDFRLGKGFIAHVEPELMNTFVPSTINGNPDDGHREWVWSLMTGMKKEYKIYKNLKGTVLIQYNWLNPQHKAPYVDRLNSRIGFEYTLKKKVKKAKS